jgi:hypothetical protein
VQVEYRLISDLLPTQHFVVRKLNFINWHITGVSKYFNLFLKYYFSKVTRSQPLIFLVVFYSLVHHISVPDDTYLSTKVSLWVRYDEK